MQRCWAHFILFIYFVVRKSVCDASARGALVSVVITLVFIKSAVWPCSLVTALILNVSRVQRQMEVIALWLVWLSQQEQRVWDLGKQQRTDPLSPRVKTTWTTRRKQTTELFFFLFCFLFLWSSHQLPPQWLPSRPRISRDTPSHWPGNPQTKPMESSWSMRSSTMRRWVVPWGVSFLLNCKSKSNLRISAIFFLSSA